MESSVQESLQGYRALPRASTAAGRLSLGVANWRAFMRNRVPLPLLLLAVACWGKDAPRPCGLSRVVGPSLLLSEFSQPGQALATPPARLPEQIVVRYVAGPAVSA